MCVYFLFSSFLIPCSSVLLLRANPSKPGSARSNMFAGRFCTRYGDRRTCRFGMVRRSYQVRTNSLKMQRVTAIGHIFISPVLIRCNALIYVFCSGKHPRCYAWEGMKIAAGSVFYEVGDRLFPAASTATGVG